MELIVFILVCYVVFRFFELLNVLPELLGNAFHNITKMIKGK